VFEDRDEEKELDKQTLRKLFQEEMALAIRNGVIDPDTARKLGIARGLYREADFSNIPAGYGLDLISNPTAGNIGQTGGNTMAEDAGRTDVNVPNETGGGRLRKMLARKK
jgi:hypothetical protein